MDGASKFVRGDAIAGIIITLINIVGGLFIGVIEAGMSLGQAASLFTTLTIGDGLVSQVPAFLDLVGGRLAGHPQQHATAICRPSSSSSCSRVRRPWPWRGGFLGILIFTSLPRIPLVADRRPVASAMAVTLIAATTPGQGGRRGARNRPRRPSRPKTRVEDYLAVDPMEVEIGVGLIRLADPRRGGDLLERIQRVRQNVAADIGIILPKVRIRDNMRLDQNQYRIKIADMPVAEGAVHPAKFLAMDSGATTGKVSGHGHQATRPSARPPSGSSRPRATGRDVRLHGGRAGQRDRHAPHRDRPPPRRRNPHPRRRPST